MAAPLQTRDSLQQQQQQQQGWDPDLLRMEICEELLQVSAGGLSSIFYRQSTAIMGKL